MQAIELYFVRTSRILPSAIHQAILRPKQWASKRGRRGRALSEATPRPAERLGAIHRGSPSTPTDRQYHYLAEQFLGFPEMPARTSAPAYRDASGQNGSGPAADTRGEGVRVIARGHGTMQRTQTSKPLSVNTPPGLPVELPQPHLAIWPNLAIPSFSPQLPGRAH